MSEPINLNAHLEVEFGGSERLELDEQWVTYLDQSAEIPSTVAGIDPSMQYDDDDTALA
jgi:hypothetical protein